ncbi:hypothetical protein [Actinoplanes sp. NPDC049265]|uniref:hypothetical protein n=1 Tax=Actinoplanes sp. NPDC049265 TaxID=3363902 RepID=UPI003718E560
MTVEPGRHRRPTSPARRALAVVLGWSAVLIAAPHQNPGPLVHDIALFAHLGSTVAGFGAVLLVDWAGLLWLARRRTLTDVLRTARTAHVPTWAGFAGLLASGLFLGVPADAKAVAVLVIGLNGVWAAALLTALDRHTDPPAVLLARSLAATLVSQLGWWTALVLGFLTSRPR